MVDLDSALDEVRRFATRPPGQRPTLERLDELARSSRWRRRGLRGACAALIVLAGGAGLRAAMTEGDPAELRTTDDESSADTPVTPSAQMQVEPATDLESGQIVTITLPEAPTDDAIVAQCASEAAGSSDPAPWCDLAYERTSDDGAGHFQFAVLRSIQTSNGLIDCAERAERCAIGVRSGGRDYVVPISFRQGLGPIVAPTLVVDRPVVADGDQVSVTGTGFAPGTEVYISQCRRNPVEGGLEGCDGARGVRLTADADGTFERALLVHHEIFGNSDGWFDCEPCVLQATASRQDPATAPIEVTPGDESSRPRVQIVPGGPYQRDQRVQLRGSGFQANADDIEIGWCRFNTDDPATEAQGAGPEYATCAYPAFPRSDAAGNFVIDDFPMPSQSFGPGGATCEDPAARCGLAWHPSEGSYPVYITFFEMISGQ